MKQTYEERIKEAQAKLSRLRARRREVLAAQQAMQLKTDRKNEFRRKLLAGAWMLTNHPELVSEVAKTLTSETDRALFGA